MNHGRFPKQRHVETQTGPGPVQGSDLPQQVEAADLQSLDLCQQLHVLHFVVWDDLEPVLVIIPEGTTDFAQIILRVTCLNRKIIKSGFKEFHSFVFF